MDHDKTCTAMTLIEGLFEGAFIEEDVEAMKRAYAYLRRLRAEALRASRHMPEGPRRRLEENFEAIDRTEREMIDLYAKQHNRR
tara:strand:- start:1348 stop:1599 length:252 start_codon:yes stop_codon:yes gene_type:complete